MNLLLGGWYPPDYLALTLLKNLSQVVADEKLKVGEISKDQYDALRREIE